MGIPQMSVSFDSMPSVGGDTAANFNQLHNIVHFLFYRNMLICTSERVITTD